MMTLKKSLLEDNSKATYMNSLPEDVIILILVTFPIKVLMQLRCVSKSWDDLIRSPKFIEMHSLYTKHKKNECILFHSINTHRETVLSFLSYESLNVISPNLEIPQLNFVSNNRRFNVSNSCNGLLLLVSYDTSSLILCNPATREFKLLPPHLLSLPDPDREKSRVVYKFGLGFDSNKNEYKAYVDVCNVNDNSYISLIYNVSTNSWRQIKSHKTDNKYCNPVKGLLYNGALHWAVLDCAFGGYEIDYFIIICLDMRTDAFQQIKFPQIIPQNSQVNKILTIVNDCLALFTLAYISSPLNYVDIWVMKEYGVERSWTKQFSVSVFPNTFSSWYPCLLWKNEAILIIETELLEDKPKLLSCALDTHNIIDIRLMNDYELHGVMLYKESLVSV